MTFRCVMCAFKEINTHFARKRCKSQERTQAILKLSRKKKAVLDRDESSLSIIYLDLHGPEWYIFEFLLRINKRKERRRGKDRKKMRNCDKEKKIVGLIKWPKRHFEC